MTREEQIKKQADIYTDDASNYAEWSDDGWSDTNDIELVEKAFIKGAKWADANPKSQWISVDEDLPYLHENMVNVIYEERFESHTDCVFIMSEKGHVSINYMYKIYPGKWHWRGTEVVTHWMPIPKLPKE